MESCTLVYFSFLLILLTLYYFIFKRKLTYWKDRNVYQLETTLFEEYKRLFSSRRIPLFETVEKLYNEAKEQGLKYCGNYNLFQPRFIPVDIKLISSMLQTDFVHFVNRGGYFNEEKDPLTGHLFNLEGEKWRHLRSKLTPTFTSGKMKMMFQTMVDCTSGLQEMLKEAATINDPIDIKDILNRFTTDIISSVAFGLEISSMKNRDSDFRKYGQRIFQTSLIDRIKYIMVNLFPRSLTHALGIKLFKTDTESFFINLVKNTVEYRENHNIYRKDFMHLLIQLKNMGRVSDGDENTFIKKSNNNAQGLTINEMAAQTFVFFVAGFETSSTAMTFALLELAQNKDIQERVREEITHVLEKYNNIITYEALAEMNYLEKIVLESLRKHPPLCVLPRVCTKDYQVPGSNMLITAGTKVGIPVYSIHRDAEYYPDPEKFDPERFNEENKATRPPFTYMPFGEGPRTCIGLRFGKLQAKVGLCAVLRNYNVTLNDKTELPIKYTPGFFAAVKGGVWLKLDTIS